MSEREPITPIQIEIFALNRLEQGRRGWDLSHTKAVVYYAGRLALAEGLDPLVLVTAAWLHDIGYSNLFDGVDATQHAQVKMKKTEHMRRGARMAKEFLQGPEVCDFYTSEQIERIVHLVEIHDEIEKLSELDETVLMEADTLGAIDISRVTPSFNYENAMKYIDGLKKRRRPRFRTELGKQLLNGLLLGFRDYFEENRTGDVLEGDIAPRG